MTWKNGLEKSQALSRRKENLNHEEEKEPFHLMVSVIFLQGVISKSVSLNLVFRASCILSKMQCRLCFIWKCKSCTIGGCALTILVKLQTILRNWSLLIPTTDCIKYFILTVFCLTYKNVFLFLDLRRNVFYEILLEEPVFSWYMTSDM